jgi:hypothetical protein
MQGLASTPQDIEQQRAELQAILASKLFTRAPSIARLLSYLCHKYFEGEIGQIKEYTVAVELYERAPDFHSKEDPIVRVEATRLRARLKEYYQTEGKDHPILIGIPLGQYAPVFQRRQTDGAAGKTEVVADAPRNATTAHNGSDVRAMDDGSQNDLTPPQPNPASVPPAEPASTPPAKTIAPRSRVLYFAGFSIVGIVLILAAVMSWYRASHRSALAPSAQASAPAKALLSVPAVPEGPELRIMAGSSLEKYVDRLGKVWESDRYFSGGDILTASPATLQRAEDSHLCKLAREGDFDYIIPLKPGIYELHLYFAEMQYGFEPEEGGETSRLFNVFANDRLILEAFDVFSDAGGGGKLDEKIFTDISPGPDGRLHLSFRSAKDKAILNGLTILPGIRGGMRPVRITTRTASYLSEDQRLWEPDRFFRGGRSVVRLDPVEAAADDELYQSERYGNFTYAIPVAQGHYRLTLKFAETYFGPTHPQHVGPEKRLFDVYCNGQTLLKDFNIAREAGGLKRAVDKVFYRLQPNAQGKLVLSFVPVMNYACVNAIEVVPE